MVGQRRTKSENMLGSCRDRPIQTHPGPGSTVPLGPAASPARTFNFGDPEKVRELDRRGGATPGAQEQLDREIANGRVGLYLDLSSEQYRELTAG
jgi:hypothetical protein